MFSLLFSTKPLFPRCDSHLSSGPLAPVSLPPPKHPVAQGYLLSLSPEERFCLPSDMRSSLLLPTLLHSPQTSPSSYYPCLVRAASGAHSKEGGCAEAKSSKQLRTRAGLPCWEQAGTLMRSMSSRKNALTEPQCSRGVWGGGNTEGCRCLDKLAARPQKGDKAAWRERQC